MPLIWERYQLSNRYIYIYIIALFEGSYSLANFIHLTGEQFLRCGVCWFVTTGIDLRSGATRSCLSYCIIANSDSIRQIKKILHSLVAAKSNRVWRAFRKQETNRHFLAQIREVLVYAWNGKKKTMICYILRRPVLQTSDSLQWYKRSIFEDST